MHLTRDDLLGSNPWKGGLDLLNIVLIGISNDRPEHDGKYELHRLLSILHPLHFISLKLSLISTTKKPDLLNALHFCRSLKVKVV